jgi:Na+-transporting NADH:ubiquinone oxidoreductase subunit B
MNLERMRAIVVVALMPALLVGMWNVGRQAAAVLDQTNDASVAGNADALSAVLLGLRYFLPVFVVAVVAGGACQSLFAWARGRAASRGLLLVALLFTLALPPSISLWKVAIGIVFGIAIGEEVFGGPGKSFLNPALVGVVFLYFAYPDAMRGDGIWVPVDGGAGAATALARARIGGVQALAADGPTWLDSFLGLRLGAFGDTSVLACMLGAALLVSTRLIAWRILAGGVVGLVAALLLARAFGSGTVALAAVPWYWHLTLGSFAFALVFFATDPVTTPTTGGGRWVYGLLVGAMTILVRLASASHTEGVMLAILLGNTAAPLIDHFTVRRYVHRRRHRGTDRRG